MPSPRPSSALSFLLAAFLAWPWSVLGDWSWAEGTTTAAQSVDSGDVVSHRPDAPQDAPLVLNVSLGETDDEGGESVSDGFPIMLAQGLDAGVLALAVDALPAPIEFRSIARGLQRSQRLRC